MAEGVDILVYDSITASLIRGLEEAGSFRDWECCLKVEVTTAVERSIVTSKSVSGAYVFDG